MKNHISREQFLLEFFVILGGRHFGTPKQFFVDDPNLIFNFIEECKENKQPAFISVQPMRAYHILYGLEKIFYDFDYGIKSDQLTPAQIKRHTAKMLQEIKIFLYHVMKTGIQPLIIKTRKGYHIYIYLDRVYDIGKDEDLNKEIYGELYKKFTKSNKHEYKYIDLTSDSDIFRMSRIPLSIHEKSGKECIVVDHNLKPTKFRSIEFYKMYGLRLDDLLLAKKTAEKNLEIKRKKREKAKKEFQEMRKSGEFSGDIRPCFQVRMDKGEMCHAQRLAWLSEIYHAGFNTPEKILELCRETWNDFDVKKSMDQIEDFFKHERWRYNPYRCETIQKKKWCLKSECGIYLQRAKKK